MYIYHLKGTAHGWDTYSDMVVIAENEETARRMHPLEEACQWVRNPDVWADHPEDVTVILLGKSYQAVPRIICKSFHAG